MIAPARLSGHWDSIVRNRMPGIVTVLDPEKGVCADPVGRDATLGVGGPGPQLGSVSVS